MPDYSYLFREFEDQVVDTQNSADPVAQEIKKVAEANGLKAVFNKVGSDMGGAAVLPPANQVTIDLVKGRDNQWRVIL